MFFGFDVIGAHNVGVKREFAYLFDMSNTWSLTIELGEVMI